MSNAVTVKDLEVIRHKALKAIKEAVGPVGLIKFIQMYNNGEGDYTAERREKIEKFDRNDLFSCFALYFLYVTMSSSPDIPGTDKFKENSVVMSLALELFSVLFLLNNI